MVAQAKRGEVPATAQGPGGLDHGHDVGTQNQPFDLSPSSDPMGQPRCSVRRLGGVLGHVGRDGSGILFVTGHEHPDIVLGTPTGSAQCRTLELADRHADLGDDRGDGPGEQGHVEPGWRVLARPGSAVGPEHHVEVDEPAGLELDDFEVREAGHRAQLRGAEPCRLGDLAIETMRAPGP